MSHEEIQQIFKSQTRLQIALTVLAVAVAISSVVTWRSTSAMREATEIQRQWLSAQKTGSPRKAALARPSGAHRASSGASTEVQHASATSNTKERAGDQATASAAPADAHVASTNPPGRPGRR